MATRKRRRPASRGQLTITLPKVSRGPVKKRPVTRKRSNTVAAVRWGCRWGWRGARWAAPKVAGPVVRAAKTTGAPVSIQRLVVMRNNVATHGFGHTFTTDHSLPPHDGEGAELDQVRTMDDVAEVYGPDPGDTAAMVRQARYEHALLAHQLRGDAGPVVTRALDRLAERVRQYEFEHAKAQMAAKNGAAPNPAPTPRLIPVPASPNKETTMPANVADFANLSDPDIDPMDFAEQLPEFLGDVVTLFQNAAGPVGELAEHFAGVPDLDPGIVVALNEAAEAYSDAVSAAEKAQQAAQSAYGDFTMPRFDKVG